MQLKDKIFYYDDSTTNYKWTNDGVRELIKIFQKVGPKPLKGMIEHISVVGLDDGTTEYTVITKPTKATISGFVYVTPGLHLDRELGLNLLLKTLDKWAEVGYLKQKPIGFESWEEKEIVVEGLEF